MEQEQNKNIKSIMCIRAAQGTLIATLVYGILYLIISSIIPSSLFTLQFRPPSFFITLLVCILILPCSAVAARHLLCPGIVPSSRIKRIVSSLSPASLCSLSIYLFCGGASFWLSSRVWSSPSTPCSERRCLDERTVFLVLSGLWAGFVSWREVTGSDAARLSFPPIRRLKFVQIKETLLPELYSACRGAVIPVVVFAVLYKISRLILFPNSLISSFSPSVSLLWSGAIFHNLLFTALFFCSQRWLRLLLSIYLTESYDFSVFPSPDGLSSTLRDPRPLLRQLSACDLVQLSSHSPDRRQILFSLSNPGGHATNWKDLSSSCLNLIEKYSSEVEELAGDAPQPIVSEPIGVFFKPIDRLNMRNLAYPNAPKPIPDTGKAEKTIVESFFAELLALPENLKKKPAIAFLFSDLDEIKIKSVLAEGRTVTTVCRGLSELSAISLTEDNFGVVQDTLPDVITAFLRLKKALDRLSKSSVVNKKSLRQDVSMMKTLVELKSAVRRNIYRVTVAFGKLIEEIPLDESNSRALQAFIDMRES